MYSMPRLLYQRTDAFMLQDGEPGFYDGKRFHPCREQESIFVGARRRGYRTYMLGWYHPYFELLGAQADLQWSVRQTEWIGPRRSDQLLQILYEGAYSLFGNELLRRVYADSPDTANAGMVRSTRKMIAYFEAIIDDPSHGQFVVLHLPVPHYPYAHDRNGPRPFSEYHARG